MKISSITILLLLAVAGLSAQSGLFGLAFGDTLNRADSLLASQRFFAKEVENTLVKYYSSTNKMVESIVLVVYPEQETVAGWFATTNTTAKNRMIMCLTNCTRCMAKRCIWIKKKPA